MEDELVKGRLSWQKTGSALSAECKAGERIWDGITPVWEKGTLSGAQITVLRQRISRWEMTLYYSKQDEQSQRCSNPATIRCSRWSCFAARIIMSRPRTLPVMSRP